MPNKPLRVFLCHGSGDKDSVRLLYNRLRADGIDSWLDEEKLLPGQDWRSEIPKAIRDSDVIVICLSKKTITKEGYVQKEIRQALDVADEKPEGTIYLIPAKLEECPMPDRLSNKHWVNLFEEKGYAHLISALRSRAKTLHRKMPTETSSTPLFVASKKIAGNSLKKSVDSEKESKITSTKDKVSDTLTDFLSLPPVPFVNRVDEIDAITATASAGGQYFLVDAPAGYGKTYLLNQLDERFKAKGKWDHAFVSVKKDCGLETLTYKLAEKLEIKLNSDPDLGWGYRFCGALKKRYQSSQAPAGLVLLIDLDGEPSISLLRQLLDEFIPQIWESLAELDAFSSAKPQSLFRVIVSGRNVVVTKDIKTAHNYLPLINHSLTPFTYDVICQSARNYLPGFEKRRMDQLAAHVLFLTGGHPGCMARVLQFFRLKQAPIDRFIADFGEIVWEQIVHDTSEKVWKGLPRKEKNFQEAINRLSIFRYVNNYILRHVMDYCPVPGLRDEIDLRDMLTTSYLYTGDGRFLQDDINRRLVTIRLRHMAPKAFKKYCKDARKVCLDQLREPNVQLPEKWVIEFLNQTIQQHAGDGLEQPSVRTKITGQFYREVSSVLRIRRECKKLLADWREEIDALLVEMEKDTQWEFRFSVNYFLRENQYDDEPYQKLKNEVRSLARSRQEAHYVK